MRRGAPGFAAFPPAAVRARKGFRCRECVAGVKRLAAHVPLQLDEREPGRTGDAAGESERFFGDAIGRHDRKREAGRAHVCAAALRALVRRSFARSLPSLRSKSSLACSASLAAKRASAASTTKSQLNAAARPGPLQDAAIEATTGTEHCCTA